MEEMNEFISIRVGDYIQKKNFLPFDRDNAIAIKVKNYYIKTSKAGGLITIKSENRNKYEFNLHDISFVIISQDDAIALNKKYSDAMIIHEVNAMLIEESCFTTNKGVKEEKVKYETEKDAFKALWPMMLKYPEKVFEAYKCKNCEKFHIGKPKIVL